MGPPPLRIGMSARLMHAPPRELGFPGKTLQYLEQSVAHWIMSHGALAFMIPTIDEHLGIRRAMISVRDYVAAMDGLVLQGGADVSPASYGETPLRPEWSGDHLRDRYEIELLWEFVIQGKPVLGICRGMQLINVACGGSLWQDIPEQITGATQHRDHALYDRLHHRVELEPDSWLARIYQPRRDGLVNSIHHQAVCKLGSDLRIEARSPADGVIEAIRGQGGNFLFGCQWHPEFHGEAPELLDGGPLMNAFLEAARISRV